MASRSGFVALIGAPNAGKSTLFNRLIGSPLSIVTPKPQTTWFAIRGIATHATASGELAEIVLVDTPGIFFSRRERDRAMVEAAWSATAGADVVLFVLDASRPSDPARREILARLTKLTLPALLVINKIDLVPRAALLPMIAELNAAASFRGTFLVSAAKGEATSDVLAALAPLMPEGPRVYPAEQLSDLSERMLAAELVREQIFRQGREEVPYDARVEISAWEERRDGSVRVGATIFVARPGQKGILIGAKGARVRDIGTRARARLAEALGRPAHLTLRIEVAARPSEGAARPRSTGREALG